MNNIFGIHYTQYFFGIHYTQYFWSTSATDFDFIWCGNGPLRCASKFSNERRSGACLCGALKYSASPLPFAMPKPNELVTSFLCVHSHGLDIYMQHYELSTRATSRSSDVCNIMISKYICNISNSFLVATSHLSISLTDRSRDICNRPNVAGK